MLRELKLFFLLESFLDELLIFYGHSLHLENLDGFVIYLVNIEIIRSGEMVE